MLKPPQSYLTESEKTLLMIEWPDPSDVLGYSGVSRTQLSIARHSGAVIVNGRRYTYFPASDELWRDDALALVRGWRKEAPAQKSASSDAPQWEQLGMLVDVGRPGA